MYDLIRRTIEAGGYDLQGMVFQINQAWLENAINTLDREQLLEMARENANPENSYAPVEQRMTQVETALRELEARVAALEAGGGGEGGGSVEPTDEWPAYVDPTGAHDAYMTGDKVTFNGHHYVCQIDHCVWSPAVLPSAWQDAGEAQAEGEGE